MANATEGGFRFRRMRNGAKEPSVEIKVVATSQSGAIFKGDPVKLVNDGTVVASAIGELIYGVCDGVESYWDGTAQRKGNYLPDATAWGTVEARKTLLRVIPARGAVFEVDADDGTTAATEAAFRALINENCDHNLGTGSTVSGQSGSNLDISTHVTTTAGWRIVGLSTRPDNDFTVTRAKVEVVCNETNDATLGDDDGI